MPTSIIDVNNDKGEKHLLTKHYQQYLVVFMLVFHGVMGVWISMISRLVCCLLGVFFLVFVCLFFFIFNFFLFILFLVFVLVFGCGCSCCCCCLTF